MNRSPYGELDADPGPAAMLVPVVLGLVAGVAIGLVSFFALGRLTIAALYDLGNTGVAINAVLGMLAAALIGFVAAALAAVRLRSRGVDPHRASIVALATGLVAVLLTIGIGLGVPLRLFIWALEMTIGVLGAWLGSRRALR